MVSVITAQAFLAAILPELSVDATEKHIIMNVIHIHMVSLCLMLVLAITTMPTLLALTLTAILLPSLLHAIPAVTANLLNIVKLPSTLAA